MKYRLTYGIIRNDNSITSRDVAMPEDYDTREQAADQLNKYANEYSRYGYKIWFSEITEIKDEEAVK